MRFRLLIRRGCLATVFAGAPNHCLDRDFSVCEIFGEDRGRGVFIELKHRRYVASRKGLVEARRRSTRNTGGVRRKCWRRDQEKAACEENQPTAHYSLSSFALSTRTPTILFANADRRDRRHEMSACRCFVFDQASVARGHRSASPSRYRLRRSPHRAGRGGPPFGSRHLWITSRRRVADASASSVR